MAVQESVTAEFIYLLNEKVIQKNFHNYSILHCYIYWMEIGFFFCFIFFSIAIFNINFTNFTLKFIFDTSDFSVKSDENKQSNLATKQLLMAQLWTFTEV